MISLSSVPNSGQNPLKTKKIFFLTVLLVILGSLIVGLFIVIQKMSAFSNQANKIEKKALSYKEIDSARMKSAIEIVGNTKLSDKERYQALRNVYFYFSSAYSTSHDPEIREFVNSELNSLAKKYFPDQYKSEGALIIPCADPTCGQDFNDDLRKIFDIVKKSSIDSDFKSVIGKNLTTASYIPESNKEEKLSGFSLVKSQLEQSGNKEASVAAELLKNYVKRKYNTEI